MIQALDFYGWNRVTGPTTLTVLTMIRTPLLSIGTLVLASTLLTPLLSGCCKKQLEEAKKKSEAKQQQRIADIKAYYKDLSAVAAAVKPTGQLTLAKCDDALIASRNKTHAFGGRLLTVDHEFLSLVTGPAPNEEARKELSAWKWVRSQEISRLRHPDAISGSSEAIWILEDIERAKKKPFFGVVRTEKRAMPIVPEGTDDFVGGVYKGWIVVVDFASKKAICQAPFSVRNSDEIKYKEGRFSSEADRARAAAKEDFRENFEAGANAALKKVSGHLRVNLGLFQL